MRIIQDTEQNPEGGVTITTRVEATTEERRGVIAATNELLGLAGIVKIGGLVRFDESVSIILTQERKSFFYDAAFLLRKLLVGDEAEWPVPPSNVKVVVEPVTEEDRAAYAASDMPKWPTPEGEKAAAAGLASDDPTRPPSGS